jgi:hypothetical protein
LKERTDPIASTDETEESSQEDWHLGESHQARHCVEEVHKKTIIVPTFLMSGAASTLRRSSRLRDVNYQTNEQKNALART